MDLSKILSISGKSGLFKLVGEAKNNIIVESLIDGKKYPAFSHERISSLKEISIYTETGDEPLENVLKKLYELQQAKPVESVKKMSGNELKTLFEKAIPDYDKEAVYVSDIKKVFSWYNILLDKDLLEFDDEKSEEENIDAGDKENTDDSKHDEAEKAE